MADFSHRDNQPQKNSRAPLNVAIGEGGAAVGVLGGDAASGTVSPEPVKANLTANQQAQAGGSNSNLPDDVVYTSRPFDEATTSNSQPPKPSEPKVQKINVVKQDNGFRIPFIKLSCRSIACLGCLIPLLAVLGLVILVLFKPEPSWAKTKDFINKDLDKGSYAPIKKVNPQVDVDAKLNAVQSNPDGSRVITLTEVEFASILAESLKDAEHFYLDVTPQKIRVIVDADANPNEPLWFYISLDQKNGALVVTDSGFGRIKMPGQVVKLVKDNVDQSLDFTNLESDTVLVKEILGRKDYQVNQVILRDGEIVLSITVQQ